MDRASDDERLIRDGDHARLLERYRYPISQRVRLKVPERDVDDVVSEVILFLYLAVLPPRDRDVAKLRFLLGFEVAEIAAHLRMEPNAVHQAVWRARRRLRELLDG